MNKRTLYMCKSIDSYISKSLYLIFKILVSIERDFELGAQIFGTWGSKMLILCTKYLVCGKCFLLYIWKIHSFPCEFLIANNWNKVVSSSWWKEEIQMQRLWLQFSRKGYVKTHFKAVQVQIQPLGLKS